MKKIFSYRIFGAVICLALIVVIPKSYSSAPAVPDVGPAFCLSPQTFVTGTSVKKDYCWCDKVGPDVYHGRIKECISGTLSCQAVECNSSSVYKCCYSSNVKPPHTQTE